MQHYHRIRRCQNCIILLGSHVLKSHTIQRPLNEDTGCKLENEIRRPDNLLWRAKLENFLGKNRDDNLLGTCSHAFIDEVEAKSLMFTCGECRLANANGEWQMANDEF